MNENAHGDNHIAPLGSQITTITTPEGSHITTPPPSTRGEASEQDISGGSPSLHKGLIDQKNQPWSQREGESTRAWTLFMFFCSLGYKRTLERVAKQRKVSNSLVRKLSSEHEWIKRAAAFDAALERERTAEVEASRRRQIILETQAVESVMKMVALSAQRLATEMAEAQPGDVAYKFGLKELNELGDTFIRLSRLQRGEVTDHTKIEGESVADILLRRLDELAQRTKERSEA